MNNALLSFSVTKVFDSGSSCSNEECWELDKEGSKVKITSAHGSLATSSSSSQITNIQTSHTSEKVYLIKCNLDFIIKSVNNCAHANN